MNKQTLGTCSNCGGPVTVDTIYWSVIPPVPTCEGCGAQAGHGPVIPMGPPRTARQFTTTTGTGFELLEQYKAKLASDPERYRKFIDGWWETGDDDWLEPG